MTDSAWEISARRFDKVYNYAKLPVIHLLSTKFCEEPILLVSSVDPVKFRLIPLLNAIGRTLFASIIVYYVIVYDIIRFVLIIGVIDVLISIGFVYFLTKTWAKPLPTPITRLSE